MIAPFTALILCPTLQVIAQVSSESHSITELREAPSHLDAQLLESYGELPLSFEANRGQADKSVKFLAKGSGFALYLTSQEAVLALHESAPCPHTSFLRKAHFGHSPEILGLPTPENLKTESSCGIETGMVKSQLVRMKLANANPGAQPVGVDALPGSANYFIGNDPAKWRRNVSTYSKVKYKGVYPGVDLIYYGNQRQLEYDFVVAPGADPKSIRLRFAEATRLRQDSDGNLVIATNNGNILFRKPEIYQKIDGRRRAIAGRFKLLSESMAGFELGHYDRSKPLVIDPILAYSTYLGGSTHEYAVAIAVDASGEAFVTGLTWSDDFPLTPGAYDGVNEANLTNSVSTAYVSKFNASGTTLLYSTYLGGSALANTQFGQGDYGHAIAVDSQGDAYLTGWTYSSNFPVTPGAFQTTNKAFAKSLATGFVSKLNANGTVLIYSTYLGGSSLDLPISIALDSNGNVFTSGTTYSTDYPTTSGAFQTVNHSGSSGNWNNFVSKMNSNGTGLIYSTYLGGSGEHGSFAGGLYTMPSVAIDTNGNAYTVGFAQSTDFPVTAGAYQTTNKASGNGGSNITLSKLNPTGTALVYSTYLGGSSYPGDFCEGVVVDSNGDAYVTGYTYSSNFPTTSGAFQTTNKGVASGESTGFASKMNPTGTALVYSTFLGGSGGDDTYTLALDNLGDLFIGGMTNSTDFPVTPQSYQTSLKGGSDAFLAELNPSGTGEVYSTFFGGSSGDAVLGVALDPLSNIYLAGYTSSSDFPITTGAFEATYHSTSDTAFAAELRSGSASTLPATATTLTTSQNPQVHGSSVTFTAVVKAISGTTIPTGTVVFDIDESPVVSVPIDATGKATYATSTLSTSQHYIVANYSGSNAFSASGGSLTETITGVTQTPVITPASGTYALPQTVAISDGTAGATIYYTTNGSTPTTSSPVYYLPLTVSATETIEAMAVGSGDTPSAVATATYTISTTSLTLVDPAPHNGQSLLDGLKVISAQAPATGGRLSGADMLVTEGRPVVGVAADGVTEVVVRIPMKTIPSTLTLTVWTDPIDNQQADSQCTLSSMQPSTSSLQDGGLEATGILIPAFASSMTVSAVATIDGPMAFAVFSAPADFARPGNTYDAALKHKSVCIVTSDSRSVNVAIYRPPVFLIHGLWGSPDDWKNFTALTLDYVRFDTSPADYSKTAGDSVSSNEPGVLSALRTWIWSTAITYQIADVQADVVTHSMGGLIARDMLLDPSFLSSDNRLQGLIHKLITIDTPHNGSQFASRLEYSPCHFLFGFAGRPVGGAISDLMPGSALLNSLNNDVFQSQNAHAIVGIANTSQQSAVLNTWTASFTLKVACPDILYGGFQSVFNGDNSDLVVSESSQQYGFSTAGATQSPGTIHSVNSDLFPLGPDALDQVISNGKTIASSTLVNSTSVVNLLNTFITDSSFVSIQP